MRRNKANYLDLRALYESCLEIQRVSSSSSDEDINCTPHAVNTMMKYQDPYNPYSAMEPPSWDCNKGDMDDLEEETPPDLEDAVLSDTYLPHGPRFIHRHNPILLQSYNNTDDTTTAHLYGVTTTTSPASNTVAIKTDAAHQYGPGKHERSSYITINNPHKLINHKKQKRARTELTNFSVSPTLSITLEKKKKKRQFDASGREHRMLGGFTAIDLISDKLAPPIPQQQQQTQQQTLCKLEHGLPKSIPKPAFMSMQ